MEKALLVSVKLYSNKDDWPIEDLAAELEELAGSTGVQITENVTCLIDRPSANLFIGSGKAEEISLIAQETGSDTVIFSHDLSGTQQRNLEEVIGKKTIDRTQLILDIFAHHAKSPEGKTQVELAQLQYLMPRLIGKGLILSRQGGGIGTSGPGETKLEIDRRRIRARIEKLKDDLKHLSLHRQNMRKRRKENQVPTVALVGYTNAGKSTLLNALTCAGQLVQDKLFTTLDPLSKSLTLPGGEHIIISDTVGFLHELPHHLIEAFKATLEEVMEADLLIHVLDASHPKVFERAKAVSDVLIHMAADNKPMIVALNKIDQLEDKTWLGRLGDSFTNAVTISAISGENINLLLAKISEAFGSRMESLTIKIPHNRMDLVNLFYKQAKVKEIQYQQKKIKIELSLPKILSRKIAQDKDIEIISFQDPIS
ncbi:MAG: GTPase HflX [Candidatus Omnitrophica bacterium]|jgi:GTP-binding protein HflX|nr:GTPase HflX [Candidatus Omnitrophota bacterium]MDD5080323.1 GTPase HflX [Candidatus Omnitrophota bacterium]